MGVLRLPWSYGDSPAPQAVQAVVGVWFDCALCFGWPLFHPTTVLEEWQGGEGEAPRTLLNMPRSPIDVTAKPFGKPGRQVLLRCFHLLCGLRRRWSSWSPAVVCPALLHMA